MVVGQLASPSEALLVAQGLLPSMSADAASTSSWGHALSLQQQPAECETGRLDSATSHSLGWIGTVLAVLVFAAPIETMVKVYVRRELGDFDHLPFCAMLVMALLWVVYSLPFVTPCRPQILVCNSVGLVLNCAYIGIFVAYADAGRRFRIILGAMLSLALALVVSGSALAIDASPSIPVTASTIMGYACVVGSIAAFGSPLAILSVVLRTRSVQYMPLSLALMIALNCLVWTVYGAMNRDGFVLFCNGSGLALGIVQLGVYTVVSYCCTPRDRGGEATPLKPSPSP